MQFPAALARGLPGQRRSAVTLMRQCFVCNAGIDNLESLDFLWRHAEATAAVATRAAMLKRFGEIAGIGAVQ